MAAFLSRATGSVHRMGCSRSAAWPWARDNTSGFGCSTTRSQLGRRSSYTSARRPRSGDEGEGMKVVRAQPVVEHGKSFRTKTLRLHPLENTIFDQACEALNSMERTQLMQEAVIFEAARLGIRWS